MKIFIGPYKKYWGPNQLSDLLKYVGVKEYYYDKIGEFLSETWLDTFCEWIDKHRNRNIKIKIHNYDIWNLDHTLSLIILPSLKLLKEQKQGVPHLLEEEQKFIPEELRYKTEDYDKSGQIKYEILEKQWEYILEKIIKSFELMQKDEMLNNDEEIKIKEGLILFGMFYRALWD